MAEENTNTETPVETPPTNEPEMVPASKLNNLIEQIKERNDKLAAYEAKESESAKLAQESELQKKLEQDKHMEVIESLQTQIKMFEQTIAEKDLANTRGSLERRLMDEGINDKYQRRGMIDEYFEGEKIPADEWIEALKKSESASFEAPKKPLDSGPAGTVPREAPQGDLESRLKSEDLAVRRAANQERFHKRLRGELPTE